MEELIEKLEELKKEIEKTKEVSSYLEAKDRIFSDKSLLLQVEEYRKGFSSGLKEVIEKNPTYLQYKEKEMDVNLLIFGMNQKFKKLNQSLDCRKDEVHEGD